MITYRVSKLAAGRDKDLADIATPKVLEALDWMQLEESADLVEQGMLSDRAKQEFEVAQTVRKLSFRTFLQRTLQNLSINDRTAPHQLAKELPENPRLLQPLCLYVALVYDPQQRTNLFRRFPSVGQEFARWPFLTLTGAALEQALDTMQDAENGYHKRWCSYVCVTDSRLMTIQKC